MSQSYLAYLKEEERKRQMTEVERLQSILERGSSDAAVDAAIGIIKKHRPELLIS